jgi:feruloyl esterase
MNLMKLPILVFVAHSALAATCADLVSLHPPNTAITLAQTVEAGAFNDFKVLPAFCRVAATLTPSADSNIKIEVWLPAESWNGKLQAVGNGGWGGYISYPAMALALAHGYATASTDTGHATQGASSAMGHPEKLVDFGSRAVHEMTLEAKVLIAAFYSQPARHSYWNSCSTGGRQGLMEAQRFPADFDGIVAGAPANYLSHLQPWTLWVPKVVHESPGSFLPPAKLAVIHKAVIEACEGADRAACLTTAQVEAACKLYGPVVNSAGTKIFPGFSPGSEMGWGLLAGAEPIADPVGSFKYVVFNNPDWDWTTLNFDSDVAALERAFEPAVDANQPDLRAFAGRGGKLIMYHGWNDHLIAPGNTVDYYNAVLYTMGAKRTNESVRLFMVPGMMHCRGGDGTADFDMIPELDNWVEPAKAPDRVVASRTNPERTRPLCPYPLVAVYKGAGNTDAAKNFVCGN